MRSIIFLMLVSGVFAGCNKSENKVNTTDDTGWLTTTGGFDSDTTPTHTGDSGDTDGTDPGPGPGPGDGGVGDDTGDTGDTGGTSPLDCTPAAYPEGEWNVGAAGEVCITFSDGAWGCMGSSMPRTSPADDSASLNAADEVLPERGLVALDCACTGQVAPTSGNVCDLTAVLGLAKCGADSIGITYKNADGGYIAPECTAAAP